MKKYAKYLKSKLNKHKKKMAADSVYFFRMSDSYMHRQNLHLESIFGATNK